MTTTDLNRNADMPANAGELARLTAEFLAAQGFRVTTDNADPHGTLLRIAVPGVLCKLYVGDQADIEFEWIPEDPQRVDPRWVADMAAALLSDRPASRVENLPSWTDRLSLKGIVGTDLRARGYDVELNVDTDEPSFGVYVDIGITTGGRDNGIVFVSDDGSMMWVRDFWHEHLPTADLARIIATALSRAGINQPPVQ